MDTIPDGRRDLHRGMLANVAGGEDAGYAGLHVFIDRNLSNRRQRQHTAQKLRIGLQPDANQNPLDL